MNTALLVTVLSFFSLVAAAVLGGAIGLGTMRLSRWITRRPRRPVLPAQNRESIP